MLVENEMLASELIPLSYGRTCIYFARADFHGLCSSHSWLSYKVEMFSFGFGGKADTGKKKDGIKFQKLMCLTNPTLKPFILPGKKADNILP